MTQIEVYDLQFDEEPLPGQMTITQLYADIDEMKEITDERYQKSNNDSDSTGGRDLRAADPDERY